MPKIDKKILRIIDANLNRAKEGLRVCEDLVRLGLDAKLMTAQLKQIRHGISFALKDLKLDLCALLKSRDILKDVGKKTISPELLRKDLKDIFYANIQRVKESMRVLEEVSKIYNEKSARALKGLRYKIYDLEKRFTMRLGARS